ncbi:MAG: hypothetical protein NC924_05380 [Candidatus Omnitrophica bacterium]|nr:hypothetical protein [Candidatus Omnitrophota bacterium]
MRLFFARKRVITIVLLAVFLPLLVPAGVFPLDGVAARDEASPAPRHLAPLLNIHSTDFRDIVARAGGRSNPASAPFAADEHPTIKASLTALQAAQKYGLDRILVAPPALRKIEERVAGGQPQAMLPVFAELSEQARSAGMPSALTIVAARVFSRLRLVIFLVGSGSDRQVFGVRYSPAPGVYVRSFPAVFGEEVTCGLFILFYRFVFGIKSLWSLKGNPVDSADYAPVVSVEEAWISLQAAVDAPIHEGWAAANNELVKELQALARQGTLRARHILYDIARRLFAVQGPLGADLKEIAESIAEEVNRFAVGGDQAAQDVLFTALEDDATQADIVAAIQKILSQKLLRERKEFLERLLKGDLPIINRRNNGIQNNGIQNNGNGQPSRSKPNIQKNIEEIFERLEKMLGDMGVVPEESRKKQGGIVVHDILETLN